MEYILSLRAIAKQSEIKVLIFAEKKITIIYAYGIMLTTREDIFKEKFLNALGFMRYRGLDAALCYSEHNKFKLGHNQLKILDLKERSKEIQIVKSWILNNNQI